MSSRRWPTARAGWGGEASSARTAPLPPLYPAEEMHGLIPADPRTPMDMRGILERLVDASKLDEFKKEFGTTLITGFARIEGHPVKMTNSLEPSSNLS